jgi:hypothetical protein
MVIYRIDYIAFELMFRQLANDEIEQNCERNPTPLGVSQRIKSD